MSLTVLRLGVDTLEATIGGPITPDTAALLAEMKAEAQRLETPQYLPFGCFDYAVQPHGAKPYRYQLTGEEATVRLTDSNKLPGASLRLSALGLALYEPGDLYELVSSAIAESFGPYGPDKLSRIDVACDFQGFIPSHFEDAKFVCPAEFRPIYPNIEHPETFHFGKGDVVVRVYNKTAEIEKSNKTWMYALWEQHPDFDPSQDVWRFEVQLRRDALRQLGFDTPQEAIGGMQDLLHYGLSWADLRIPISKNKSRWPRHEAWTELSEACSCHTTLTRDQLQPTLPHMKRIVSMLAGYAISAGAVMDSGDFFEVWRILGDKVYSNLISTSDYAEEVCKRQMQRLGQGG